MNRFLAILVVVFSFVAFAGAQVYSDVFPYGGPVVTTPFAVLPGPATAELAVSTGGSPMLMSPGAVQGWINAYSVGASNATFPNNAGATNSTYGSSLYQPPYATMAYVGAPRVPGVFNAGAAVYGDLGYTDMRSLGQVAAELKSHPKPPARVYTNADISRLKQPQQGTTVGPQTPPASQNPNLPQQ